MTEDKFYNANDLKISKKSFIKALNAIISTMNKIEKFENCVNEFNDCTGFIFNIGDEIINTVIKLLENAVGDRPDKRFGSMIEWWLYEDVPKIITIPVGHKNNPFDKEITLEVETPEKLYNYFLFYH